jgi:hypothetical protein
VKYRFLLRLGAALLLVLAAAATAGAQNIFEKLVMPGELIQGHAKLEKECSNCHESFTKGAQSKLCLACHKDITRDRELLRGLHGKRQDALKPNCSACHPDHKGRTADVVQLDKETFNHALTNFPLNGGHKEPACDACHKPNVKFRNTLGQCIDCHKQADKHKGRLGDKCQTCHSEDSWSKVRTFDHQKTKFPLTGAHEKVLCATCHPNEKYKGVPLVCSSCHQLQDVHQGKYGPKCESCHDSTKWKTIHFNHSKTKFPLHGAHIPLKCEACHTGDLYKDKLQTTCIACHKKDDPHKGQLGQNCQQCHNENAWRKKVAYDHDLTRFPLLGKHAIVPCEQCHKSQSFKDTSTDCASCHKDQHHQGTLGDKCAACHSPNGWTRWRFDHDTQTEFKLTGKHKGLACGSCHREKTNGKMSVPSSCYGCHQSDDAHSGGFGRACEKCHNTNSFR